MTAHKPVPIDEIPPKPDGRCHRWLDDSRRWCGQKPIGKWMVGPLCGDHAPNRGAEITPPPESVHDVVARVCRSYSESSERSQQVAIGLSEIGDPCDRAVAYKLWQQPGNRDRDNHLADVGTAWHSWVAAAFEAENQRLGRERYRIEQRVWIDDSRSGTCDLFDVDTGQVLDHKLLGVTSMRKIRSGEIPEKYQVQMHAYGYGWARAGYEVREVALVCYPRSDNLAGDFGGLGLHVHTEPFDEDVAKQALARLWRLSELSVQLELDQHPERWAWIQATPSDACRYCPYFRPHPGPADSTGCPGQAVAAPTTLAGIK